MTPEASGPKLRDARKVAEWFYSDLNFERARKGGRRRALALLADDVALRDAEVAAHVLERAAKALSNLAWGTHGISGLVVGLAEAKIEFDRIRAEYAPPTATEE